MGGLLQKWRRFSMHKYKEFCVTHYVTTFQCENKLYFCVGVWPTIQSNFQLNGLIQITVGLIGIANIPETERKEKEKKTKNKQQVDKYICST